MYLPTLQSLCVLFSRGLLGARQTSHATLGLSGHSCWFQVGSSTPDTEVREVWSTGWYRVIPENFSTIVPETIRNGLQLITGRDSALALLIWACLPTRLFGQYCMSEAWLLPKLTLGMHHAATLPFKTLWTEHQIFSRKVATSSVRERVEMDLYTQCETCSKCADLKHTKAQRRRPHWSLNTYSKHLAEFPRDAAETSTTWTDPFQGCRCHCFLLGISV